MIDLAELEIGLYIYSGTGRLLPHSISDDYNQCFICKNPSRDSPFSSVMSEIDSGTDKTGL